MVLDMLTLRKLPRAHTPKTKTKTVVANEYLLILKSSITAIDKKIGINHITFSKQLKTKNQSVALIA